MPPRASAVTSARGVTKSARQITPWQGPPMLGLLQAKASSEDNCFDWLGIRFGGMYRVVPLSVERVASDVEGVHLLAGDGNPFWIMRAVKFAFHRQAGLRGGRRNQVDDDAVADQRRGVPVQPSTVASARRCCRRHRR